MNVSTRITITDDNGIKFFGEGPWQLLRGIEETGSLRSAALSMEMAYSKATRLLKQAEASLGFPLTTRTTGGRDGGGSRLTPGGKAWLDAYEAYRDTCIQANGELFRKFFPRVGCVIMASGLGKRFGSNKLMADFRGEPLFLQALRASEGLGTCRVVVTRHEEVARLCRQRNVRVILHDLPHRSDTVRLGLEALGDLEGCLFLPADQPLLRRETVEALVASWKEHPQSILRPVCLDRPGAPVLFPAWAFPELRTLPQGKGGGWVIRQHPGQIIPMPIEDPLELADADTPEALEFLRQQCEREKL